MKEDQDEDSRKDAEDRRDDEDCCKPADNAKVKRPGLDLLYVLLYLSHHCELIGQGLRLARSVFRWRFRDLLPQFLDDRRVSWRYPAQLLSFGLLESLSNTEQRSEEEGG